MSMSLEELCQMVNVSYDEAKSLLRESESSDGESPEREVAEEAGEKDGEIMVEDGEIMVEEGEKDGEIMVEEGEKDGEVAVKDGEIAVEDGEIMVEDGEIMVEEGEIMVEEGEEYGEVAVEDGDEDGEIAVEDGEIMMDDGDEDGEIAVEDGEVHTDSSHEEIEEDSPPPRKRQKRENTWKKNINKKERMNGKAYVGKRKSEEVLKEPRVMGSRCSSAACIKSVKYHCSDISEAERETIFRSFWSMTWEEKRMYVRCLIDVVPVQRRRGSEDSRRSNSLFFFLKVNGQRKRVCKRMFLSTIGVGEWSALNWAKETHTPADAPTHKNRTENHKFLFRFLQALPKLPSHYCRSSTSKLYLEPVFQSIVEVHAEYCRAAQDKMLTPLSRQVFSDEFKRLNLSLYQPKKDQCDTCCAFKAGNMQDNELQNHLLKKEEARAEKQADKNKASDKTMVLCMDLQALLLCPKLKASALYYKTKLAVHNFTMYNMSSHNVTCYVWHEGEGSLSASEFASCIVNFISGHEEPEEFILWSDGCGYQNRNSILASALLHFATEKKKVIIQKYLEKGHTQMECDSVHSLIERRVRNQDVYVPAEYVSLMQRARVKPKPYEVCYVDLTFFQDFTKLRLCQSLRPGTKTGDPTVHDLRAIRYNINGTMDYKTHHSSDWEPFPNLSLRQTTSNKLAAITPLYTKTQKIKEQKFQHLQDLKEVIPKDFHSFYDNLPH